VRAAPRSAGGELILRRKRIRFRIDACPAGKPGYAERNAGRADKHHE